MFTGIIQRMGRVVEHDLAEKWGRIVLDPGAWDPPVEMGESIAVQGICLTVAAMDGTKLRFDVLRETFERTNLGEKKVGDRLNMERSLRWGDAMGGHIVIGHVDGVGRVRRIDRVGRDWSFEIAAGREFMDSVVFKGSVACDGVSLTVAALQDDGFVVHIIPFTYEHTSFGGFKIGDGVNLEMDVLSKFVRRYVERGVAFPGVTWASLREAGLTAEVPPTKDGESTSNIQH